MTTKATGTFEVKILPLMGEGEMPNEKIARMSIDKTFSGDLEGTSKGQMISAGTEVAGSAGYVAMEMVTGTLRGKKGTFVLQHTATMNRGVPQLSITVVPDSGTEALKGISGQLEIIIAQGKHSYNFSYKLPENP